MNAPVPASAFGLEREGIRRRERRAVAMRGYIVREDGKTSEILLLDLAYEGCGLQSGEELRPGEAVKLSILRRGAIDAEVRWCVGGKAGLVFAPDPQPDDSERPRRSARISTTADVVIRRIGRANYRVRVVDLSTHGCKVELVERPNVGEHILVRIDGLETLEAEVCWVTQDVAGVRFEKPIHPAVFDLLAERLKAAERG